MLMTRGGGPKFEGKQGGCSLTEGSGWSESDSVTRGYRLGEVTFKAPEVKRRSEEETVKSS